MIDFYYWPTPNGHKVTMFLEETGLAYNIKPINIGAGDQFRPDFLKISPNNRMPAMVDLDPADGAGPLPVFESGAMLTYLGEKTGKFLPTNVRKRADVLSWLNWQMGGIGPMFGQANHFRNYHPEVQYGVDRYSNEANRLLGVLDIQLTGKEFITGEYSIADMASYPWVILFKNVGSDIAQFPEVKRWIDAIAARPATISAYAKGDEVRAAAAKNPTDNERAAMLFNQTAATVRKARGLPV